MRFVPRLRMRIWRLMALVAVAGLVAYVCVEVPRLRSLGRLYRTRAQSHLDLERSALVHVRTQVVNLAFWSSLAEERRRYAAEGLPRPDSDESWEEAASRSAEQAAWHAREVATFKKRAEYHGAMHKKWLRATRYPWLWVDPDAPLAADSRIEVAPGRRGFSGSSDRPGP